MNKFLPALLLIASFLSGCACMPSTTVSSASPESTAKTFIETINKGDINSCLNMVTDDVLILHYPPGTKVVGKENFSTNLQQLSSQKQKFTITSVPLVKETIVSLSAQVESLDLSIIGLQSLKTGMEFQLQDSKIKSWTTRPDPSDWQKVIEASPVGIGIKFESVGQGLRILEMARNSPALEGGAGTGEIIIAVNGITYSQMHENEMSLRLRGPIGSKVTLTIIHEGNTKPLDIEITRVNMSEINF
jgi:C-terminal processing protease CtpA/Prc